MKYSILFFSILGFQAIFMAQQTPQSSVYNYNRYAINPAYAGSSGCTDVTFSHLNQWVKVEGAPLTSYVGINTRLGKSFGVGGQVLIDKIGMVNQVSGLGSLSYGLNLGINHKIRIGASVGYNQYRVDPSSAIVFDPNDPIANGGVNSAGTINSELGLLYQFKNLEVAVASKQLIQSYTNFSYNGLDGYGLRRHMNGLISYAIPVNDNFTIKPSVFAKGINSGFQTDMNADVIYKDFLYGGLGYRTQVGLIARVGVNIQDLFFIGYAYESPMANIASYSSGSHEVVLGLKFCKNKKKQQEIVKNDRDTSNLVRNVEIRVDTLVITKVDTIYIEKATISKKIDKSALINKNILFEFDKAIVQKVAYGELESLINILVDRPEIKIELQGHTDAVGAETYNVGLSKNRVNAVREFLIANGIDTKRIICDYHGETKPKG
ncbi:MAG: type IX secretion system membrane protein PorP/SprF, partial [Bacteroidetes bacterium]|nr:type IX secretion system membrane protein PorP/SprF [Bacteroidota bacterium]